MNAAPQRLKPAPPNSSKPPRLRELRYDDHPRVAALALKFDLGTENYAEWIHLWGENPAFASLQNRLPMGWVLEGSGGELVGYLGNIPLSYEFRGKRLLAVATRSWVVDDAYRGYSLLLLGTYFQQKSVDLFLATTVNSQSLAPFKVFQGTQVPVGAWDRTLFWITHPYGFAGSLAKKKKWAFPVALSYLSSLGFGLHHRLTTSRLVKARHAFNIVSGDCFDDRFDGFWLKLRERKSHVLLAVRDRRALDWHFGPALAQKNAWIFTVDDAQGLAAYAIFLRQDRGKIGLKRVSLVDFQCLDESKASDILAAMLGNAILRCRSESIHMLELVGPTPALEQVAKRAFPFRRQLPNWMYFYKANNRNLEGELTMSEAWEPSLFDGDCSL